MDYSITPIKNLRRLSPEEEKELKKVTDLRMKIILKRGSSFGKMTRKEIEKTENEKLNTILDTMRLVEESKDQELATERERLAADKRQLQNIAENITKNFAAETPLAAREETSKVDTDTEINSATKEQQWRDDAPGYMPNAAAIKMAEKKISAPNLSKLLRKPDNPIRWMHNKNTKRCKVHTQDFLNYLKILKTPDGFVEEVFEQRARQDEIDLQKEATGK